jgi:hypothetical protein
MTSVLSAVLKFSYVVRHEQTHGGQYGCKTSSPFHIQDSLLILLHTNTEKPTPSFSMCLLFLFPLTSELNGAAKKQRKLRDKHFLAAVFCSKHSGRIVCVCVCVAVHRRAPALSRSDRPEHRFVHIRMLFLVTS